MTSISANHDPYHLISKIFYDEIQCNDLITLYSSGLQKVVQDDWRSVEIKQIDINSVPRLLPAILSANENIFELILDGPIECYFAKYSVNDHYDKYHIDCGPGSITRKLSFTLFLNEEYTGGDFFCMDQKIKKERGKLIVFPSFLSHKVSKISAGTRYAIFGFFLGPRLK